MAMFFLKTVFLLTEFCFAVSGHFLDKEIKDCPKANIRNGYVVNIRGGRKILVYCNANYILYGQDHVKCSDQGLWSPQLPSCIKTGCDKLAPPKQGILLKASNVYIDSVVSFKCKQGYRLTGADRVFCDGKSWSDKPPTCVKSPAKGNYSCSFDLKNDPFCGWAQGNDDDFDWTRWSGKNPDSETGPSADHTRGDSQGHYVYIETSELSVGQIATLTSMVFPARYINRCIEFYYHSFGRDTGKLSVIVKQEKLNSSVTIFSVQNISNNSWIRGYAKIEDTKTTFSIVFEATVGGYFGDIALDDINIYDCREEITTEKTSPKITLTSTTLKTTPTSTTPKTTPTSTSPKTTPTSTSPKITPTSTTPSTTLISATHQASKLGTDSTSTHISHTTTKLTTQAFSTTLSTTQIVTLAEKDIQPDNLITKVDQTTETLSEDISMVTLIARVLPQENFSLSTVQLFGTSGLLPSDVSHIEVTSTSSSYGGYDYSGDETTLSTEEQSITYSSETSFIPSSPETKEDDVVDYVTNAEHFSTNLNNINNKDKDHIKDDVSTNQQHNDISENKHAANSSYETFTKGDRKENIMVIVGVIGSLVAVLFMVVILSCLIVRARTKRRLNCKATREGPEEGQNMKEVIVGEDAPGFNQTDQGGCIESNVGIEEHQAQTGKVELSAQAKESAGRETRPDGNLTTEEVKDLSPSAHVGDDVCKMNQVDWGKKGVTNILVLNSTEAQNDVTVNELAGDGDKSNAATKGENQDDDTIVEMSDAGENIQEAGEDGKNEPCCTVKATNQEWKEESDVHGKEKSKRQMWVFIKNVFHKETKAPVTEEVIKDKDVEKTQQGVSGTDAEQRVRFDESAICIEEQNADAIETKKTAKDYLEKNKQKVKENKEKRRKKEELKKNKMEEKRLKKEEKESKKKKSEIKKETEQRDEKKDVATGEEKELIVNGVDDLNDVTVEETPKGKDEGVEKGETEEMGSQEGIKDAILVGITTNPFDLMVDSRIGFVEYLDVNHQGFDRVPENKDRKCRSLEDPGTLVNDVAITAGL